MGSSMESSMERRSGRNWLHSKSYTPGGSLWYWLQSSMLHNKVLALDTSPSGILCKARMDHLHRRLQVSPYTLHLRTPARIRRSSQGQNLAQLGRSMESSMGSS